MFDEQWWIGTVTRNAELAAELEQYYVSEKECFERDIPETKMTVGLKPQFFNIRLFVGLTIHKEYSYDDYFCYTNTTTAIAAFLAWDGTGDPLDGWIRNGKTGRRRPDGDKTQEYINH